GMILKDQKWEGGAEQKKENPVITHVPAQLQFKTLKILIIQVFHLFSYCYPKVFYVICGYYKREALALHGSVHNEEEEALPHPPVLVTEAGVSCDLGSKANGFLWCTPWYQIKRKFGTRHEPSLELSTLLLNQFVTGFPQQPCEKSNNGYSISQCDDFGPETVAVMNQLLAPEMTSSLWGHHTTTS
ncbi:hypothetical protein STEG23_010675, partial [Scotinomys teguina]